MRITFDYANLTARMVGESNGITPGELKSSEKAANQALRAFNASYNAGLYGFPSLPSEAATIKAIEAHAKALAGTYDTVCVVGIGGSALGAWALDCGLRGPHPVQGEYSPAMPRLVILDNVDPMFIEAALASMKPKKTHVVVIAKSGATAETVATFLLVKQWLEDGAGKKANERITVVTSEGRGDLKVLASSQGYVTFHLPDNVGGRFSVLSAVGLVPAALAGMNIRKICKGAAEMTALCWKEDLEENVALRAAQVHHLTPIACGAPRSGSVSFGRNPWAKPKIARANW
jgi:glucose-6-phosphate isomerase